MFRSHGADPHHPSVGIRAVCRSAQRGGPMQKPSLLVVEDEPGFSRLLTLSLVREGFEVRTATNGEDALDLAAEMHPDAVVLDLGLPGMDGFEVLRELRE